MPYKRNYDDPQYTQFRKDVLKRDNKKCQMPGCGSTRNLNVHHIQKWSSSASLRYEPSNGITLCRYCHNSIKNKEDHYISVFKEIINGKI